MPNVTKVCCDNIMPGLRLPSIYTRTQKKGSFASNHPNTPGNLACKISNPMVSFTTLENASVSDLYTCTGNKNISLGYTTSFQFIAILYYCFHKVECLV